MGALPLASLRASLEDGKNRPTDRPLEKRPFYQIANLQFGKVFKYLTKL